MYFMKKFEDSHKLKHAKCWQKTTGYVIKEFLCDNGGRFDNMIVEKVLQEYGMTLNIDYYQCFTHLNKIVDVKGMEPSKRLLGQ